MSTKGSDFFESVEDFVSFSGGDHAIKKILIANNGIGATKAIRSIRRWSFETFGNERIIKFVVMATPEDMRANAEYIRMADEVVDVPGGSNNNNYANINLICQIADRLKVDAVMPMWGHASENPALPTSLLKLSHKVTFIGPAAEPMQALGDKIGSTIIAQSAGVPTIAWNGDGLTVDYKATGIPQSVYDEANVTCAEDALTCCERIGYPVMIKASEGGGGKGIRKVLRSEDVLSLYRQVQGEIPGSPIFVMKMASKARHLEVQLIADKYGEAIALSGRDCSVQRRHQKIIEEGPPIAAPLDVFKRMEQAAVALAKTVGYCNAGTVEYLYLEETQKFAFLELNPRLQVEHPVTENILGLNLPSCQLQVAMGVPLHRIGDIRKMYGRHPRGRDTIDFEFSEKVPNPRHCIAVRVTAENPEAGFQPTSGIIKELHFHSAIDVWGYFSVDNSGLIHEFADSQFGHIFASGKDRESARRAMIVALKELQIRGDIRTTIEYIIKMLQSADFVANRIDTDWLDGRIANHKAISIAESNLYCPPATLVATCGAALQGYKNFKQRDADFINMLKVGQVPTKDSLLPAVSVDLIYENVKFKTRCTQCGNEKVIVTCNEGSQNIGIRTLSDGGYLLNIGGQSHVAYSTEESGGSIRMILDGHTCIFTPEYDPTVLTSTVAGKLARLLVEDGSHVNAGEPFVEIEVMKMYMSLKALEAGTVHFQMSEGATLIPGDVIATVRLDKPDSVVNSEEFKGQLFASDGTVLVAKAEDSPQIKLRESLQDIEKVLQGFPVTDAEITAIINNYIASLKDGLLPACKVEESLSVLRGRIDAEVAATIADLNDKYKQSVLNGFAVKYPAAKILMTLQSFAQSLPIEKRAAFNSQVSELWSTVEPFIFSTDEIILASLVRFLEAYLDVERQFDNMSFTDVVNQLRKDNPNELEKVLQLCRSHVNIKAKNVVLLQVIDLIKSYPAYATIKRPEIPLGLVIRNEIHTRRIKGRLGDLAKLRQPIYSHVSFAANLLLIDQFNLTVENRRQRLNESIISALTTGDPIGQGDRVTEMKKFIDSNIVFRDILIDSLRHDKDYQIAVMELYLRKTYQKTHDLINFACGTSLSCDGSDMNSWVTFEFMTTSVEAVVDTTSSTTETTGITKSISFTDLMTYSRQSALTEGDETNRDSLSSASSDTFKNPIVPGLRNGVFALIESFAELPALFPLVAAKIPNHGHNAMSVNAIHVAILSGPATCNSADEVSAFLSQFLATQSENLNSRCIRRVTFFVDNRSSTRKSAMPTIFTFRSRNAFQEDRLFRHIEAPHAFHLDLPRLSNFSIKLEEGVQTYSGNVHLYKAVPKTGKGPRRYFARLVSFTADILGSDFESLFVEALDHLALVLGHEEALDKNFRANNTAANHIFINVVSPDSVIQPDSYDLLLRNMSTKYWYKMVRLAITTVELKLTCRLAVDSEPLFIRLVASNPTGFVLKIDKYFEAFVNGKTVFKSVTRSKGPWDGLDTTTPYDISQKFENQRAEAMAASDTLYVYDWPLLFENATEKQWLDYQKDRKVAECAAPENFFHCRELVLCDSDTRAPLAKGWTAKHGEVHGIMRPVDRDAGLNDAGMVAWHMTLRTPECPEGRELVVICNDITFQAGSFGTKEDIIFFKASEYARQHGLPRLFLTANSGARIGMAQSLKSKFQVCWQDDKDPSKGFKYIYINDADYQELLVKAKGDVAALPVVCSETVNAEGETRHLITDIIGEEPDLGVENLMGSGLIAGETARAYDEIFTLTMVVGRTVGIGAYLVRLGQRTIQKTRNAPIILTGYQALNKLMGREIYTTNDQLGGPMIMFPNGVSHLLAETHLEVVSRALDWLSFVPAVKNGPLPIRDIVGVDSVERLVHFTPQKGLTYDPRLLFCGLKLTKEESSWKSGFFDKNSFVETLSGWAKTVVVGRGRLGGIPMGVIVTENRTAEATKPADPADLTSQEKLVQQAGGVWFPDSAYKTAQALRDFNREGLPCIIFANWRGFSGGQRDMFDEVLKFGSMIVDALVAYQQPLFVYIPPFAELRGGAWVVVDSTINADVMEFYAAEDARGGVLEAAGAASIKFRDRDIVQTAHRIDPVLIDLDAKLLEAKASGASAADVEALSKQIAHRERMLFGVYQQVAVHFADLHDTPGRMKAKGVIRRKVQWAESRKFFYWRLRRRLLEFDVASQLLVRRAEKAVDHRKKVVADLQQWFLEQGGSAEQWEDDKHMMHWFESHKADLNDYVAAIKNGLLVIQIGQKIADVVQAATSDAESPEEASLFLKQAFLTLSPEDRAQLLAALKD